MDVRLGPPALTVWAVAWWATGAAAAAAATVALGLVGVATVALLLAVRSARARPVALVVALCLAAGSLVAALASAEQAARTAPAVLDLATGGEHEVLLRVTGDPVEAAAPPWQAGEPGDSGRQVRVRAVLVPGTPADPPRRPVPVSVQGGAGWSGVQWGETVRARVRADVAPAGGSAALFLTAPADPEPVAASAWQWRAAERVREGLVTASGADGVRDGAGLLPGLVVGDTDAQPPGLVDDMRVAGLAHLTAVSGSNVTIVCGGTLLLCVVLRLGRRAGAVVAAAALLGLVVVARPDPSVLRAAVMGGVGLLGLLLGRRGGGLAALSVAVVAVVLVDPWLARAPGFRLSVVATGALVVGAGPLARLLGRVLPRTVAWAVAVPAVAQAAVTPVLLGLEPAVAVYALPANVLAAPAVAPATVLGVLAALASLLHPPTAALLAAPARWCADWVALVARTVAALPGATLPWPAGPVGLALGVLVVTAALAAAVLVLHRLPDRRGPRDGWAPWPRPRGLLVGALVLVLVGGALLAPGGRGSLLRAAAWPGDTWPVVVCDVGQGDALLVRSGTGRAVVVDTGPDGAVVACLRRAGVTTVDLLLLTHLHADHVGGLTHLAPGTTVRRAWAPTAGQPPDALLDLRSWAAEHDALLEHPVAGRSDVAGSVRVDVLAPATAGRAPAGTSQDVNDAGLVVRLTTADGLRVLAVGDLGSAAQERLLRSGADVAADVTTVAHHGSADQLGAFYRRVGAALAVASAGRDNPYGHPSPRGLDVVTGSGSTVLATSAVGAVAVRWRAADDGAGLELRTGRRGRGRRRDVPA